MPSPYTQPESFPLRGARAGHGCVVATSDSFIGNELIDWASQ